MRNLSGWNRIVMIVAAMAACVSGANAGVPEMSAEEKAKFEQDRQAILAMAGEYRVKFRFMETVPLRAGYELKPPYVAGATEFIDVIEDTGDRIVLQHVLVLTRDDDDDKDAKDGEKKVHVVKHWRQDWTYEDTQLFEFKGHRTWTPRTLAAEEVEGTWSQTVSQVDDSPRYESFGKWTHQANLSSWEGGETWRPLPRREFTKRKDYHVLGCVNRHTITPTGWFHEEDNYKLVLPPEDQEGETVGEPILVREAGLNEYRKVADVDFSEGRKYWAETRAYWSNVRAVWAELYAAGKPVRLRQRVDDEPLHHHLFELADEAREGKTPGAERIRATLAKFLMGADDNQRAAAR